MSRVSRWRSLLPGGTAWASARRRNLSRRACSQRARRFGRTCAASGYRPAQADCRFTTPTGGSRRSGSSVFFRRLERRPPPWTDDPVLRAHKFTNAYRASDRVSQYLIRRVIYRDDLPDDPAEVVFRILLFKLFNRIETWELLEKKSAR